MVNKDLQKVYPLMFDNNFLGHSVYTVFYLA